MPRPAPKSIVFLPFLILLLISSFSLVLGDSVDDAYSKLVYFKTHVDLCTPTAYNIEPRYYYVSGSTQYVAYEGRVRYDYKQIPYGNTTTGASIAVNGSGLFYFADGLPLVSFTIRFEDIINASNGAALEAPWKERTYTVLTMSHVQEQDRYLFFRVGIQPQGYYYYSTAGILFEWGVMRFDYNTGEWVREHVMGPKFIEVYEGTNLRVIEAQIYIIPTFYEFDDLENNMSYLVYGFAARIKTMAENETSLGHSKTIGEVPYAMIPLKSGGENISIVKLDEKIKQLYGWKIFVGMGFQYVFGNQYMNEVLYSRSVIPYDYYVDFMIKNPTVYSVLVDARKVNDYFELGLLAKLNSPMGRFQSNWTITDKETDLVAGILPIGIAFIPGVILRRYNKLGGALIFLGLATFMMYMMFQDIRIIILGAVSIASLFFIRTGDGGGIG